MKAVLKILTFCIASFLFFSCQKELSVDTSLAGNNGNDTTGNAPSLIGNWNLIHIEMDASSTSSANVGGIDIRAITEYATTTINNSGVLTVNDVSMASKNVGYSIETEFTVTTYFGTEKEEDIIPFSFDLPSYSASSKYKLIGNDSLYFPDGVTMEIPDPSGQIPATTGEPSGARFSIKSDTLRILARVNQTKNINSNGITYLVSQKGSTLALYKRQ